MSRGNIERSVDDSLGINGRPYLADVFSKIAVRSLYVNNGVGRVMIRSNGGDSPSNAVYQKGRTRSGCNSYDAEPSRDSMGGE